MSFSSDCSTLPSQRRISAQQLVLNQVSFLLCSCSSPLKVERHFIRQARRCWKLCSMQSAADPSTESAVVQLFLSTPVPLGISQGQAVYFFSFTVSISTLITLNQAIRINQIPSVRGFAEGVTSHPPKLRVCKLS